MACVRLFLSLYFSTHTSSIIAVPENELVIFTCAPALSFLMNLILGLEQVHMALSIYPRVAEGTERNFVSPIFIEYCVDGSVT